MINTVLSFSIKKLMKRGTQLNIFQLFVTLEKTPD